MSRARGGGRNRKEFGGTNAFNQATRAFVPAQTEPVAPHLWQEQGASLCDSFYSCTQSAEAQVLLAGSFSHDTGQRHLFGPTEI